ncbi:tRNA 2-selenouridine(34) synthase MnmH [Maritimibacter dapengensis]|uniref:tRNA 2-selenouridine(34) synthase MnmH n=1 Tax=Maritimibacter dapengensis TaxID=2836868 RepID=A0ABS6T0H4_9RHOB|nr:tRNA 2-selenouridine(34) synthase MnmH [Maritimibacter dapengensis]MBV7378733.1 tRNA 2-selenouridine(34) synthase MnmH [Maritimibacter dapengensis]
MAVKLAALSDLAGLPFDEIIDVRSPSEFAEDHVPGAISLPVLSDEERARVGTIYVQEDPFKARKIGAALVARNAAHHIETVLADRPGGWRPLVYCWRGGQRSNSFASILSQIGWRADVVEGGYRSYRRLVVGALHDRALPHKVHLIEGGTGTAKTRLLHQIAAAGGQVVDLEGEAEHRGSLFGQIGSGQPSQKMFESRVAAALDALDPTRPVFVEAESSKVGDLLVPPSLWAAMRAAPFTEISAPLAARARHLMETYPDIVRNPARLNETLNRLRRYHGHKIVDAWQEMAFDGAWEVLAADLINRHYDPAYKRIRGDAAPAHVFGLPDLSETTLEETARRIVDQSR